MQIHELNNFSGTLGAGAYLAIDNGTDTGKISSEGLLATTEARIDNIIAGPAPSAEEIVDARLGADGITYPSLGDAIRDQFSDVKSAINVISENTFIFEQGAVTDVPGYTYQRNKTANTKRIRLADLYGVAGARSYYVVCHSSTLQISVWGYSEKKKQVGSGSGWLSTPVLKTDVPYIAIAVRKKDGSDISPSDSVDISVLSTKDVDEANENLSLTAEYSQKKPYFITGTYYWQAATSHLGYTANKKRICADLRGLELEQGDFVGIADYSTYSIALGDGNSWFENGYLARDANVTGSSILPYVMLVKRNDNADITQADIDAITNQFQSSTSVRSIEYSDKSIKNIKRKMPPKNGYIHFSFDDVSLCILNLINNSFDSVWDEPFFGMLRRLHDLYGAAFSLYIWDISNLANLNAKYKPELVEASAWLKFGFHSTAEGSMADTSYDDAKTAYNNFISSIFAKVGGVNSIDRIPRLNYFAGNINALKGLRDANCGCIGFLNADDTRNAYYLTPAELAYLRTHSLWSDRANGLQFISTVMRLDWFVDGFSSEHEYNTPVYSNPYDELVYRYGEPSMADLYGGLVVFTHEWQVYNSEHVLTQQMVTWIEQVCQFANEYGYDFDFPQNRIPNITSNAIA